MVTGGLVGAMEAGLCVVTGGLTGGLVVGIVGGLVGAIILLPTHLENEFYLIKKTFLISLMLLILQSGELMALFRMWMYSIPTKL